MMHHPSGASRGQASEMHLESRELVRVRDYISLLTANSTGQPYDRVSAGGGHGQLGVQVATRVEGGQGAARGLGVQESARGL